MKRDFESPAYKALRYATFCKWHFSCVLCHRRGVKLEMHHIRRVADFPHLEFAVSNVVPLCIECHRNLVTGREVEFEQRFRDLVAQKEMSLGKKKKKKYNGGGKGFSGKKRWKPRNPNLRF